MRYFLNSLTDDCYEKKEKNLIVRMLTITGNIASHFYYLFEHVAWLSDSKIFNLKSDPFWLGSLISWLVYLLTSIIW